METGGGGNWGPFVFGSIVSGGIWSRTKKYFWPTWNLESFFWEGRQVCCVEDKNRVKRGKQERFLIGNFCRGPK